MRVSADVRGTLRVEVTGIDGYSLTDCEPLASDATVRWKGGKTLAALKGKTVQLRFQFDNATLFAFSGLVLP